jgi:hypothetical protein
MGSLLVFSPGTRRAGGILRPDLPDKDVFFRKFFGCRVLEISALSWGDAWMKRQRFGSFRRDINKNVFSRQGALVRFFFNYEYFV